MGPQLLWCPSCSVLTEKVYQQERLLAFLLGSQSFVSVLVGEDEVGHLGSSSPLLPSHLPSPYLSAYQGRCLPPGLWKTIKFVYREDILSPFIPWTQSLTLPTKILSGAWSPLGSLATLWRWQLQNLSHITMLYGTLKTRECERFWRSSHPHSWVCLILSYASSFF